MNGHSDHVAVSRRKLLQQSALVLAGLGLSVRQSQASDLTAQPVLRFGMLTDVHHADKDSQGDRHYRKSFDKVTEAVECFNRENLPMAVELGDLIDSAETVEKELGNLKQIEEAYANFRGQRHYVLGNHCVHTLTKQEFVNHTAMRSPHCAFDSGGYHFVILDSCFTKTGKSYQRGNFDWTDANVTRDQLNWLAADLNKNDRPTVVFTHQRLDPEANSHYRIKQATEIRNILEQSGNVRAVFSGHSHKNFHSQCKDIHYTVLRAVVSGSQPEDSGYAIVSLYEDGSIRLDGSGKQQSYAFG